MFNDDYRYGIPLTVKDMNGFMTEYEIDDFGRTIKDRSVELVFEEINPVKNVDVINSHTSPFSGLRGIDAIWGPYPAAEQMNVYKNGRKTKSMFQNTNSLYKF